MTAELCPTCGIWWRGVEHSCRLPVSATSTSYAPATDRLLHEHTGEWCHACRAPLIDALSHSRTALSRIARVAREYQSEDRWGIYPLRLFETISVECAATIYAFDPPAKDHVDGPYLDSETEEPE